MLLLALGQHAMWSWTDGNGRIITRYYYDEYTWYAAALVLAWLTWVLVRRYRRARAMRRPPRRNDRGLLRRVAQLKSELSLTFLRPGFSANIHAVGVGLLATGEYCLQVFVGDSNRELWDGGGAEPLPADYGGFPLVLVEMPPASFLSDAGLTPSDGWEKYPRGIREYQEVIVGGISGANANLEGQSGTIGYFCTRKSVLPRRKVVHLLSNSHVFVDLRKGKVDDTDLIAQPSPGEPESNRPIGALVNFSALSFEGEADKPNHVDAALARLWGQHRFEPTIPFIGTVKGYVPKQDVEVGEPARKFGRTTGYTEGSVFSICLDIRVRYDRTGQSALFENQLLIEPALPQFTKFADKGDSGALVVDGEQNAIGLIFAGTTELPGAQPAPPSPDAARRVEGYGVANPIGEVLERLKIELLI